MKKIILAAILFLIPMSAYSADITGNWKAVFETQIGTQKYTFSFKVDGDSLSGIAVSDIGGIINEVTLTELKLVGDSISFTEMLPFEGMDLKITYDGVVSGNEMKLNRHVSEFITEKIVVIREEGSGG